MEARFDSWTILVCVCAPSNTILKPKTQSQVIPFIQHTHGIKFLKNFVGMV